MKVLAPNTRPRDKPNDRVEHGLPKGLEKGVADALSDEIGSGENMVFVLASRPSKSDLDILVLRR